MSIVYKKGQKIKTVNLKQVIAKLHADVEAGMILNPLSSALVLWFIWMGIVGNSTAIKGLSH